jgi:bifunctional DNA-binding transcriptional regulator/antitoxin component of YhaV-PrlF toxin-antitoxin module
MKEILSAKVDDKGRLVVPLNLRESMHIESGDVFFFKPKNKNILVLARAENPFEFLAKNAIEESRAGKTISLDDYAKKRKSSKKKK